VKSDVKTYTREDLSRHLEGKLEPFLEPLSAIQATARARDIVFIAVTQQAKSNIVPRARMQGLTYADEVQLVQQKLEREGRIHANELQFLTHDHLMRGLGQWASREGVPLVDAISAMNLERQHLVSWVHLTAAGNRIVADALAAEILRHECPAQTVVAQQGGQAG
jgi:hypothetical protein